MSDLLEYIISLRGAKVAAAEVRGLAGEFNTLAASERRAGVAGEAMGAGTAKGAAALGAVKNIAKGGALALVGLGFEAVKASASFNHEMLRIRTETGGSTRELARMKVGVLELAKSGQSMGQGPMSLALGLYHLESLGIRGSKALHALKLASQEAAISGANLEETTSALGSVLYVGIKGAGNMDHVMGLLNATVGSGNMRMGELVHSLGTGVLSSAKVAGLSLQDVTAALAVFSDSGQNASSSAAQFATALHFLYAPTTKATAALASIHIGANQLAVDLHKPHGMVVALKDIRTHLHGISQINAARVLNAILPGGRGRILLTELTMLDRAMGKYGQQASTLREYHVSTRLQQKDPTTQLKAAEAALQANLIQLGDVLGPIVLPALAKLLNLGSKLLQWLTELPQHIKDVVKWFHGLPAPIQDIIKVAGLMIAQGAGIWALAKAWGGVKAIVGLVTMAFKLLSADPLLLAVMALVGVAVLIITHWKQVKHWIDQNRLAFIALALVISPIAALIAAAFVVTKVRAMIGAIAAISPAVAGVLTKIGLLGPAAGTAATEIEAASVAGRGSFTRLGLSALGVVGQIAGIVTAGAAAQQALGNLTGNVGTGAASPSNPAGRLSTVGSGAYGGTSGVTIAGVHVGGAGGDALGALGGLLGIAHGARGAIVTRPTLALIGEAGPEAVTPLDRMPGASPVRGAPVGSGQLGTINLVVDGRVLARANRRQILEAMAAGA